MYFRRLAYLLVVACLVGTALAAPAGPEQKARDQELLKAANLSGEAPALLAFFKKLTIDDVDRERIQALINDMGDDLFAVRQKANEQLLNIGNGARAPLREATQNPDVEIAFRATRLLEQIEKEGGPLVVCVAARVLAERNPDGATEVLLNFLPSAENALVIDEVCRALAVTGFRGGKPQTALTAALSDKQPLRRAVAAEALCRAGSPDQRPAVRKLLKDPDATVRLRTALTLFDVHEKEALPVLIELLAELPLDQVWRAEDVLFLAAGDQAPNAATGNDAAARRDYRKLWARWWAENGAGLDLAKLEQKQHYQGFTLLCLTGVNKGGGTNGRVMELDADGKIRWQIEGLRYPIDAQVLGEDRVLIAEYTGRQVTERNLKGEVQWTKTTTGLLLGARRLPNGNTFIAARNGLMEVDKDGNEVVAITRPNDVAAATRLRNGQYAIVTNLGQFLRLNAEGKELKSFPVGQVFSPGGNLEVLPNGRVLVPDYSQGKVVEYDADGKQVWEATVAQPGAVTRLANGNTLVACRSLHTVVELDRNGKEVTKLAVEGAALKATRR